ncbi:MAG: hypothetical protein CMD96_08260 [Gammaproteobacteria bacterium]|nr:hypothetical protein [Gammaproteobacteria bacterium]HJP19412.1 hypothetical protein [Nitrospinota bacterium]|tara:strand:+ start:1980 stop:2204 length:225 start_codon:yes stop_codon:yes gene_type:complete
MGKEGLRKSLNKIDENLDDLVRKVGDTPLEMNQTPETISNEIRKISDASTNYISKESKGYDVKGFLKWLFTEFF